MISKRQSDRSVTIEVHVARHQLIHFVNSSAENLAVGKVGKNYRQTGDLINKGSKSFGKASRLNAQQELFEE